MDPLAALLDQAALSGLLSTFEQEVMTHKKTPA